MKLHAVIPVAYSGLNFKYKNSDAYGHTLSEVDEYYFTNSNYDPKVPLGREGLQIYLNRGWKIISQMSCSAGEGESLRAVFQYILESPELPDSE